MGQLKRRIEKEYDYEMGLPEILSIIDDAKKEFPKCRTWNQFVENMKEADVWYDVLDNKQIGVLLDWMLKFMEIHEKWFGE